MRTSLGRALTFKAHLLWISLTLSPLACSTPFTEREQRELLSDPVAQEAGELTLAWMRERVELMVRNKGTCALMAEALLKDDQESEALRASWREARAQEWLIARAAQDPDFQRELSALITKGDLVFSFCAFFEDFRRRLNP